jgi:TRAP-type C4-dicarboxylate transport system permease small subunit
MLSRLSRQLNQAAEYMLFGLGLSMTLLVAVQVFCRYALNHSIFWSEELARYLLVWMTFLGAGVAYYRKAHPGIDILQKKLPSHIQKYTLLVVHLTALLLFGVMTLYGVKFAYFVRLQISPALQLPKWIVFSIIPMSGIILSLHAVALLQTDTKKDLQ